jgi:predicted nucleic acid-binding protein
MPYLIDSDVLIAQRESQPGALVLFEQLAPQGLAISIVTFMEVYKGRCAARIRSEPGRASPSF